MKWIRGIILVTLGMLSLIAIAYAFMPRGPLVDVAQVEQGPLRVTFREEGRARVQDRFLVSAPVAGVVRRSKLEVGDTVRPGDVVARLAPPPPRLLDRRAEAEAEAKVAGATARLAESRQRAEAATSEASLARTELERARRLLEQRATTDADLDEVRTLSGVKDALHLAAQSSVAVAQHELQAAQVYGQRYGLEGSTAEEGAEICTPAAGKILHVFHESEGVVAGGSPLVEIGDPGALEVEVEVLSSDAAQIHSGTRVVLDRWGGDPLEGRVRVVEPVAFKKVSALGVEEQRVLVIVQITTDPKKWRSLGDRYRIEATFVLWEREQVLKIPNSAMFRGDGHWRVYVLNGESVELREVEIGQRGEFASEVLSGMREGEVVVVHPDDQVVVGGRVRVRK